MVRGQLSLEPYTDRQSFKYTILMLGTPTIKVSMIERDFCNLFPSYTSSSSNEVATQTATLIRKTIKCSL